MKKSVTIRICFAAMFVVAAGAGDALALRYFGGTYTYPHMAPDQGPDAGLSGPLTYDTSSVLGDGDGTVGDNGETDSYWTTSLGDNNRHTFVKMDLGTNVEIDTLQVVFDLRDSSKTVGYFIIYGNTVDSKPGSYIIHDGEYNDHNTGWFLYDPDVFIRPDGVLGRPTPIGLFWDGSAHTIDTVTVRYLWFDFNACKTKTGGENWDTGISEIYIDYVAGPGVAISESGGSTDVSEEGPTSDTYTMVLNAEPTDSVTITVDPDDQTDVGNGGGVSKDFTFTTLDWETPQQVTVTAVDDAVVEGAHTSTITHTAVSNDQDYDGVAIADVVANVTDNDIPEVIITESGMYKNTDVDEAGPTSDSYTLVLDFLPTDTVTVTVDPDAQTDVGNGGGVSKDFTFTTVNWDTAQTVNVTAVDDGTNEGLHSSTIAHTVTSNDTNYDGLDVDDLVVRVYDNDCSYIEARAVWANGADGSLPCNNVSTWDAACQNLKSHYFNQLFPGLASGGMSRYPSEVLVQRDATNNPDQLADAIAAGRKHGIEIHVWKTVNLAEGCESWWWNDMRAADRIMKDNNGDEMTNWLCPSDPDNQAMHVASYEEIVQNYAVDGVQLDYIRYDTKETCYNDGCRTRFETYSGQAVQNWPADCYDGGSRVTEYRNWRQVVMNTLVEDIATAVRAINPDVMISAAVVGWSSISTMKTYLAQDYELWCDQGWLDIGVPMIFYTSNSTYRSRIRYHVRLIDAAADLYGGVGNYQLSDSNTKRQIGYTRSRNADGFCLFDYNQDMIDTTLDYLVNQGTTDEPAISPHLQ